MSVLDFKRSGRAAMVMLLSVLALGLSGCASSVVSEFTVYHSWPADAAQPSYRFVRPPERRESLEQASFEDLARPELQRAGFVESPDGRFGVTLLFADERMVRQVLQEPIGVSPWFGWSGWWGAWHGWPGWYGWGMGATVPLGWAPVRDETYYRRTLQLRITDLRASPPKRVYETTAVSEDFAADGSKALPVMLRQVLQEFPGPAGVPRRVRTTLP